MNNGIEIPRQSGGEQPPADPKAQALDLIQRIGHGLQLKVEAAAARSRKPHSAELGALVVQCNTFDERVFDFVHGYSDTPPPLGDFETFANSTQTS